MLLELVSRKGFKPPHINASYDSWFSAVPQAWYDTVDRRSVMQRDSKIRKQFNTWEQQATTLLLKTKDGRIMNPEDINIIHTVLNHELHSHKPFRARLFACEWSNNDVPM